MTSMVGAAVIRKEDPNLLTGRGTYVDNLRLPGMLHMAFVRSAEAHARIRGIEVGAAAALPRVHGVFTARDLPELPPIPTVVPGLERPSLARDRVRFVGEPVAVVVAEDRYVAADAVARVTVDYEPLPPVPDLETALAEGAPLLFPEHGSNVYAEIPPAGDAEAALAAAPRRARLRLVNQRCAPAPMEPFGVVADWGPKTLTVWASCQSAHFVRGQLSKLMAASACSRRTSAAASGPSRAGTRSTWSPPSSPAAWAGPSRRPRPGARTWSP